MEQALEGLSMGMATTQRSATLATLFQHWKEAVTCYKPGYAPGLLWEMVHYGNPERSVALARNDAGARVCCRSCTRQSVL
jgi:hypothetical protein